MFYKIYEEHIAYFVIKIKYVALLLLVLQNFLVIQYFLILL